MEPERQLDLTRFLKLACAAVKMPQADADMRQSMVIPAFFRVTGEQGIEGDLIGAEPPEVHQHPPSIEVCHHVVVHYPSCPGSPSGAVCGHKKRVMVYIFSGPY